MSEERFVTRYKSSGSLLTPNTSYGSLVASTMNSSMISDSEASGLEGAAGSPLRYPVVHKSMINDQFPYVSDMEQSLVSSQENVTTDNRETRAFLQAVVFIEDAIEHRSIHHKVDSTSLERYRLYHSKYVRWLLRTTLAVLLLLAFIETPSSLAWSSDPRKRYKRYELPCGVTETIELLCLLILTADLVFKGMIIGWKQAKRNYWLIAFMLIMVVSYLDWFVSLAYLCKEKWRIRRLLRPFFLIQNSSIMKKTVQSIKQSVPQILSVLFLLALHLYFFTMFGMVIFASRDASNQTSVMVTPGVRYSKSLDLFNDENEGNAYFSDIGSAIMSLVVLLTTANNPDVMMPAYSDNRFYAIFFILFLAIGMYFFMNVLLAVIYNQFKGSFTQTMQSSFIRRRCGIRAAFEVLRSVSYFPTPVDSPGNYVNIAMVRKVMDEIRFSKKSRYLPTLEEYLEKLPTNYVSAKQFQDLFDIVFTDSIKKRKPCREFDNRVLKQIQSILLHKYFQYFGDLMCVLNVLVVTIELSTSVKAAFAGNSMLSILNFCFILYFAVEQILMIYFIGARRYFSHKNVWFESIITWVLVVVEILCIALYGGPFPYLTEEEIVARSRIYVIISLYNLLRITNMLIIIRLLRVIPSIKPLFLVAKSMVDLAKNLKSFGGIVIMIYYVFALIGMMIFEGQAPQPKLVNATTNTYTMSNPNITCGYEQLNYYANNFDDFAASLVVLWDVMVVNNWFVFLHAYSRTMNDRYTQIYFISWWLVSVVVCINLFVALVIEAFITQWDHETYTVERKHKRRKYAEKEEKSRHFRVHEWFRGAYREPTEEEILNEIYSHHYLRKYTLLKKHSILIE